MESTGHTDPALFHRGNPTKSNLHNGENARQFEDSHLRSPSSSPRETSDLEKAETAKEAISNDPNGPSRATTTGRISRIQSLQRKRTAFDHPLSHVQTSADVLVDFDGPDDPYRPINWPFRKKVITTALYGFTTMGSTWASSV